MDCGSSATGASNAANFWDEIFSSRIDPIGTAPPPEQYSSATTSTTEALDEKEQIVRAAIDPILSRYYDEERAVESILQRLRERRRNQEHALGSSLSIINQHRNLLTPVARLPPEILSRILVLNAQPVRPEWRVGSFEPEPELWVDAARTSSQVCRRWRQIALDCPEIWSHLSFKHQSPRWIAEMIECSRSAPLFLLSGYGTRWNEVSMGLAANNMRHFKSIDLNVRDEIGYDTDTLFKMLSRSAPMLERLKLTSDYDSEWSFATPAFPREFLSGCTPNLRHLKLRTSSYILWDSGLFANLTTLKVTGGRGYKLGLSSLEMLLTALTRMPGLELLTLRECIPYPACPTARCDHANLPNLKRLELADSLNHCTDLLRQIAINASATLLLNLANHITTEDVDRFEEVFPSHPWETSVPTSALWLAQQGLGVTDSGNARISSIYTYAPDQPQLLATIWTRFATLVSSQLCSLRISDITGWDVDSWRGFAHLAPELRSLVVGGETQTVELCKALRLPNGPNLVPEDCCFPALSHLELAAHYNHTMSAPGGGEAQLSTVLARTLAERAQIGCSTPELVFYFRPWTKEKFPDGWSEPFREAVPGITVWERRDSKTSAQDLSFLLRSN